MTSDTKGTASQSASAAKHQSASSEPTSHEPIVVDMGKKSRKQVRRLRKGKPGRLMNRVEEAIEHLRENGALTGDAQPIVIIVKEKARRRGGRRIAKMWGLG